MCGIAGIVSADPLDGDAPARAIAMREALAHRGPDDAGLHCDRWAALAHRRLSIVDLRTGSQPLANEEQTIWIVFNGEIYNHAALRRELEASGHCYRSSSDTETLVHAYEQWGDEFVQRLRGMFAFAIWDGPRRRLLLTRDRLGIKPLYWARRRGALLFASELKALFASDLVEPEPHVGAIPELLSTRSVAGAETLFRDVCKLLPGHQLVFEDGEVRTRSYWDVPGFVIRDSGFVESGIRESGIVRHSGRDLVAQFRALLEESVRLRLMSDVPLGMFLSGGIDSSAIAAIMARQIGRPLQTFSVGFEDRAFNELRYAREVAAAIGAEGHEVVIGEGDFFGALPRLVWHEDEPIAHPSSVPLYFVSTLARQHVTVVLTGEGSDELLAGYGKYLRTTWNWRANAVYARLVPGSIRRTIARSVSQVPNRLGRYARRSFLAVDGSPEAMVFDNFAAVRLADQRELLAADLRSAATIENAYGSSIAYFHRANGNVTLLDRLLYADLKTYLVELLMKQDQMSMAASIESRVPFLDHKLVEFAAQLPDSWKLSGWNTKRILREAMKGLLPDSILERPKMGFPVPFSAWTRGAWNAVARDVLLDRRSRERGIIDPGAVDRLIRDHANGTIDGGDRIWSLLNLELWYRTFIDKGGIQTLGGPKRAGSDARPSRLRQGHGGQDRLRQGDGGQEGSRHAPAARTDAHTVAEI
jgi:asparagine synthase (glutamine-hydrolysing)